MRRDAAELNMRTADNISYAHKHEVFRVAGANINSDGYANTLALVYSHNSALG